jgi:cell division protein FtsL
VIPRLSVIVLAGLLVASALLLVTALHRSRNLFFEMERLQRQARVLEAEGTRLRIELGRAGQPAAVEASARALGLKPIDGKRTVFLPPTEERRACAGAQSQGPAPDRTAETCAEAAEKR